MELTRPDQPTTGVEAVRAVYEGCGRDVFAYAARRVGPTEAEDVVAETFRRAIESYDRFDPSLGSERAWIFGIATNVLHRHRRTELRRLRAVARAATIGVADADQAAGTAARLDAEQELDRVLAAVEGLSADDHDLLVLVAWEDCTSEEVAAVLGIAAGTVRSRLHRIRNVLDRARHMPPQRDGRPMEGDDR